MHTAICERYSAKHLPSGLEGDAVQVTVRGPDKPSPDPAFSLWRLRHNTAIEHLKSDPSDRPGNDELSCVHRSQKFLSLFTRRKTAHLAIVGIVICGVRRTNSDELVAVLLNKFGEVLAIKRRHMPRAAMWTIVVARAGPLIEPYAFAAGAPVKIEKPSHASLLGSQTIASTRNKVDESAIAQILKLLANFWFDVLVVGIEIAEMPLEGIHLIKRELGLAE
jgi:hypothetical protein